MKAFISDLISKHEQAAATEESWATSGPDYSYATQLAKLRREFVKELRAISARITEENPSKGD